MSHRKNLNELRKQLKAAFIGRDKEIDGLLIALMARTHVLLLGPPGTAKSLLTQVFAKSLGGDYFQRLLTAFSAPEEVFGPYDLSALDAGKYERAIDGYLPTATTSFLDEVFKANSAVLNSLLTMLNERQFDNGVGRIDCPLQVCVGASNEYPQESSLEALYDRFQLRFWTDYVGTRNDRMSLLTCADPETQVVQTLTEADVRSLQQDAKDVFVPKNVFEALLDISDILAREHGLVVSDRRLRSSIKLIRACAALNGRTEASKKDLIVLADSLWHRHEQRPAIMGTVLEIAAPNLAVAQKLADSAREIHDGIVDYKQEPALERKLAEIQGIEEEIGKIDDGTDEDVAALRETVKQYRKSVARGFAHASGLLRALGQ